MLVRHLEGIAQAESVDVDSESLAMIARASEGSVRDALSLLDQAIAHGGGAVQAEAVRVMLGVADRSRIVDLFEQVMKGEIAEALAELDAQFAEGAAPETVLADLAAFVHLVTRIRLIPEAVDDRSLSEVERSRGAAFAKAVAIPELTRAWQILLKGIAETESSPRPLAAAEMVLIRLAHAATLPSPDDVIRRLSEDQAPDAAPPRPAPAGAGGATALAQRPDPVIHAAQRPASEPPPDAQPGAAPPQPTSLAEVAALADEKREIKLKSELERYVRIVRFEPSRIEISLEEGAPADLAQRLGRALSEWTGTRWVVTVSREAGAPTLRESAERARAALVDDLQHHPAVTAILDQFPGATIVDVRMPETPAAAVHPDTDDETTDEEAQAR